jgi:DNA repair protein RadC
MSTGHRDRLWQKLQCVAFADAFPHAYEKLEFLLTWIIPRQDTKPLAKALVDRFGSLSAVLHASAEDLLQVKGVGERTVLFFAALKGLLATTHEEALARKDLLNTPEKVKSFLVHRIGWEEREQFVVLFLDIKMQLLAVETISWGTIDQSVVFPREVLRVAIRVNAKGVILAHNHPSGHPHPSDADIRLTQKLESFLRDAGICVHDHVIAAKNQTLSLRENGDWTPQAMG